MPFPPSREKTFKMGFTAAKVLDKISFQNGRLRFGKTSISELKVKGTLSSFFYRTPTTISRALSGGTNTMTSTETYNGVVVYDPAASTTLSIFAGGDFMFSKSIEKRGYTMVTGDCFNITIVNKSTTDGNNIQLVATSLTGISIVGDPYIYPINNTNGAETNGVGTFQVRCTDAANKTFVFTRIG
jgi:hypothetical protein